jgi:hypothetical protein
MAKAAKIWDGSGWVEFISAIPNPYPDQSNNANKFLATDGQFPYWSEITYPNSFSSIVTPSGTNPTADSINDTLNITASNGINIVGNGTTDTISFSTNATSSNTASTIVSRDADQSFDITAIDFDTSDAISSAIGRLNWDDGEGTLTLGLKGGNVNLQLGQEMVALCYNGTGSTITNGSVVYISGAQGQRPSITLADADTEATSSKVFGVVAENIASGSEGFVATFGIVNGLDTSGFSAGQSLWLSSTAGQLTNVRPTQPAHSVFIGYCLHVNASSGRIFVNPQNGYELEELHNVLITSPSDKQALTYEASSGLWKNTSVDSLPSQTGNAGKYLTTDGTLASWGAISGAVYSVDAPSSPSVGQLWIESDVDISAYSIYIRWTKISSGAETTFSGIQNSVDLSYPPGLEQVYLNGVLLVRNTDYIATNGTSITLNSATQSGDVIEIISPNTFSIADVYTRQEIDNFFENIDALPSQTGNSGKYLTTDGTAASWAVLDVSGAISEHNSDTTSVHGISDTSSLVYTNDSRLSDSRTPTSHASSHESGGSDEIEISQSQVTNLTSDLNLKAPLASPTFTGAVTVPTPTNATDAATKAYVDETAQGLQSKPAVEIATTSNLSATYNNGTGGVGATLTSTSNGAFPTIDGITLNSTTPGLNGVLVKNQSNPAQNGRYNLTQVGDASNPWILTRCGLCDETDEVPGAYIFVKRGTLNAGSGWVLIVSNPSTFVVGTDSITAFQFSGAGTITAGTNISINGSQISVVSNPTFSGTVTVPTPVNSTDAATKGYVDNNAMTIPFSSTAPSSPSNGDYWVDSSIPALKVYNSGVWTTIGAPAVIEDDQLVLSARVFV